MTPMPIKLTRAIASLTEAVRRFARALLGAWLVVGPFVGVYVRETEALVVVLILLAAAYGFVAGRCASEGAACLTAILFDGLALVAVVWSASAASALFHDAGFRLSEHRWLWPTLLLFCFWLAEFVRARVTLQTRRRSAKPEPSRPAKGTPWITPAQCFGKSRRA